MANTILLPPQKSGYDYVRESALPGIDTGLNLLAQHKMNQMMQQQQAAKTSKGLAALGYNPEQAQQLSQMPPEMLNHIMPELLKQKQRSQLATLLSGGQPQQDGQAQDQLGQQQFSPEDFYKPGVLEGVGKRQAVPQTPTTAPVEKNFDAERKRIAPLAAYDPAIFQREKTRIDRAEQAHLKSGQVQTKILMPIVDAANQNIRASENKIKDLGLLKHMIEQGKWQTNKFQDIAEKFGLGTIGLSPDSELARQVGAGLALQDVKLMKGSLSDREGAWLRSMYPSLMQTAEGAKKLANKLISDQKAEKLIEEEKLKLIKKNRNIDPLSIETEAFANTQKERDMLARDMLKELGYLVQWEDDETGKVVYLPIGETPKD